MEPAPETRSARKRNALMLAATELFLEKGYDGTSMDDVAAKAAVSKPTVYKYFSDKERLFAEIVLATTSNMVGLVNLISDTMGGKPSAEAGLLPLARQFLTALMQPQVLRLRRLVMANAERFPDVGRSWYEQGFERALATLASTFQGFEERRLLRVDDPLLAANHFVGLLLWIPINKAMYTGDYRSSPDELERLAAGAVRAFLSGYGPANPVTSRPAQARGKKKHAVRQGKRK
jgi:TetR/AcrR family transcriptional regulator, mexJK operon transcriptional repressor